MEISLLKFLKMFYYIPESYVLALISLYYLGISPQKKQLYVFSLVFGICTFVLRDILLPIFLLPNGLHIVLLFIINLIFLKFIFKLKPVFAILGDFLYFITIIFVETLTFSIIKLLFGLSPEVIVSSVTVIFLGWLNLLLILVLYNFLHRKSFILIPIKDDSND